MKLLRSKYKIFENRKETIDMGPPYDYEGNRITLVDWSTTADGNWVQYRNDSGSIVFDCDVPAEYSGYRFTIYFTLSDDNAKENLLATFIVPVSVDKFTEFKFAGVVIEKDEKTVAVE